MAPSSTASRIAWHHSTHASPASGSAWVRPEIGPGLLGERGGVVEEGERDRRGAHQRSVAGRVRPSAACRAYDASRASSRRPGARPRGDLAQHRPGLVADVGGTAAQPVDPALDDRVERGLVAEAAVGGHLRDHDGHLGVVAPLAGRVGPEAAADHPRRLAAPAAPSRTRTAHRGRRRTLLPAGPLDPVPRGRVEPGRHGVASRDVADELPGDGTAARARAARPPGARGRSPPAARRSRPPRARLGVGVELLDDRHAQVLEPHPGHEGEHRAGQEDHLALVAGSRELLDRAARRG